VSIWSEWWILYTSPVIIFEHWVFLLENCYDEGVKVEVSETIKAPVGEVFRVFTDWRNIEARVSGIKKIEFLAKGGRPEVGMKWRETRVMFGREATEEMWITEIKPNQSYVVEAESHGTKYRSTYEFIDKGRETEVKLEFAGIPVSFAAKIMSVLGVIFASSVKRALADDMADLKKVIESEV